MKTWKMHPAHSKEKEEMLAKHFQLNPITIKLLLNRGLDTEQKVSEFLHPSIQNLHNPFLMKDMNIAVSLVNKHLAEDNSILVYGDYDVDGTTSVSMMVSFLRNFSQNILYYIPDRYSEGYGVSQKGITFAKENNCKLIISLDCGIKAIENVELAIQNEIDFIICDHHTPGEILPPANAILDPKKKDCTYPYKELSGCGVGFKLIQALAMDKNIPFLDLEHLLDLVAISIGADIVPITGENRILATRGLEILNRNRRIGLWSFFDEKKQLDLQMEDVVFKIAPRINAAGRMAHAVSAVDLILEEDELIAKQKANSINEYNADRRFLDSSITEEALEKVEKQKTHFTSIVFNPDWHKGVIGIVASRLIESYYRPTIVFTEKDGILTGSARSIPKLDMYKALDACSEFIEQFGGHYFAAGLQVKKENFNSFSKAFEEYVASVLTKEDLKETILLETSISLKEFSEELFKEIEMLQPFGPQNLPPIFGVKNTVDTGYSKCVGSDRSHLSLSIKEIGNPTIWRGIGFGLGNLSDKVIKAKNMALAFSVKENIWKENRSLQLDVKDIKFLE
jgi:single-stranded-DNA-specific exonuclease